MGGRRLRRVVFDEARLAARVSQIGREISEHYPAGEKLLVLGLLKGSFIFLADLVRRIHLPLQVDFLVASSYGDRVTSSGTVDFLYDPDVQVTDRHVIVVEDIVDSGTTLKELLPRLERRRPKSLEVCVLLHKRLIQLDPEPRWVGFEAPGEFLVGYGLDHAEDFRHLPFIGSL